MLQPLPSPYSAADLQNTPYGDDMEPLQNCDSLQNSSSITLADVQHFLPCPSPPKQAMDLALPLDLDDAGVTQLKMFVSASCSAVEVLNLSHPEDLPA